MRALLGSGGSCACWASPTTGVPNDKRGTSRELRLECGGRGNELDEGLKDDPATQIRSERMTPPGGLPCELKALVSADWKPVEKQSSCPEAGTRQKPTSSSSSYSSISPHVERDPGRAQPGGTLRCNGSVRGEADGVVHLLRHASTTLHAQI